MNRQNLLILLCMLLLFPVSGQSNNREKYNFNPGWLLYIGDTPGAERTDFSEKYIHRVDSCLGAFSRFM